MNPRVFRVVWLRSPMAIALLISIFFTVGGWFLEANKGLNLSDEGSLWYGAQRVLKGDVPVRDFMSYEPARYYWCGAFLAAEGSRGVLAVRSACAAFAFFGLVAGVFILAERSSARHVGFLLFSGLILTLWMVPRHKLFDASLAIILVGLLAWLMEQPSGRRFFWSGVGIGLTAAFGRNHALYGFFGGLLLTISPSASRENPSWRDRFQNVVQITGGLFVGSLPLILFVLLVPGYAAAFWETVATMIQRGSTNLTLPTPWPWTLSRSGSISIEWIRVLVMRFVFVGVLAFGIWGVVRLLFFRGKSIDRWYAAAFAMGAPYAHYAFSRADVGHLALGIFPTLLGALCWVQSLNRPQKLLAGGAVLITSCLIILPAHPAMQCALEGGWRSMTALGDHLLVPAPTARDVDFIQNLGAQKLSPSQTCFIAPTWPGAYALLQRRSPDWEIYSILPASERFQQKETSKLRASAPAFALILENPVDGRADLLFENTHPLEFEYLRENFREVHVSGQPAMTRLFLPNSRD